ncbi:hypothetical protein CHISP_0909 [Chitinispirillum alkaliphilum]|nr:hypothetical protein CHISP_0909 [Chitinispirillum alkaliphilum]
MGLKMRCRKKGEVPILAPVGELTGENVSKLMAKLDYYCKNTFGTIVVDLSRTFFIDSHGLGAFIYSWRLLEEENRRLVFLKPHSFIKGMFEGTNLDKIFKILESEEDI